MKRPGGYLLALAIGNARRCCGFSVHSRQIRICVPISH